MEGILHRALALVVSLYCNLSPHQMFLSQNTVMFIPKSPCKRIKWSLHVYAGRGRQKWQQRWHEFWGRAKKGEADRQTKMSDTCSRQLMTPGWPGGVRGDRGQKGVDNSHKCCNGWYFELSSFWGPECLTWFIVKPEFKKGQELDMLQGTLN